MKTKFITSIYSDLHGTIFGGRPSRGGHYKYSLLSLLKITDADFLCYTSEREIEDLKNFFYEQNNIDSKKLIFKIFDISNTKFKDLINQHKNLDEVIHSDRCIEIQYSKFHWWWDEDGSYDYYFWIDAGLSHSGLIPEKYLVNNHSYGRFFESSLYNNFFLKNLIEATNDKFLLLGKENNRHYWSGTVDPKWYLEYNKDYHIIGGLFGGHKDKWNDVVDIFESYTKKIIEEDKKLYHEEVIMSLIYVNHKELFELKTFDIWWHTVETRLGVTEDIINNNKSFYRILEELNKIENNTF